MWKHTLLGANFQFYSKGCQTIMMYLKFDKLMRNVYSKRTANEISKMTGLSLSQCQRNLKVLLVDGYVDFKPAIRKGKPAREWYAK